ncbi:hypothetical protein Val02_20720 [Virgisporangium aliadipatigenens]|uniref:Uncharacterized protein n=1 Tax=Virgisporangium aliadipatigenens TaxID=741659 RepID=A0A8J3YJQ3_9ACTN|nr:hypothetical protein Val02_20720 [Virgisporangium aliadipatigenens]
MLAVIPTRSTRRTASPSEGAGTARSVRVVRVRSSLATANVQLMSRSYGGKDQKTLHRKGERHRYHLGLPPRGGAADRGEGTDPAAEERPPAELPFFAHLQK